MRQWLPITRIASSLLAAILFAPLLAVAAPVGEVIFAAGDARIDGLGSKLVKGAAIEVGQTVVTGAGGHVHVRFVDDAFVAVRPNSQLTVDDYAFDAANAANNRVKFTLVSGTSRLITGKAGQANKQGFRLNTPMAAIGVRGTDFVVRASADTTRVTVQQGAVVMSPFADGCSAASSGPCSGALARQLTASLAGSYLEQRGQTAPTLIKVEPSKLPDLFAPARADEPPVRSTEASGTNAGGTASGTTAAPVATPSASASATPSSAPSAPAVPLQAATPPASAPAIAASRAAPEGFTGSANIFWGRWDTNTSASILNSANYQVIAQNNGFVLVRPSGGNPVLPNTGEVNFKLVQSALFISSGGGFVTGDPTSSRLSINFGKQTFDTAIAVRADGGLSDSMRSRGALSADGRFVADPKRSNAEINGGLSNNGAEAGYVYVKGDGRGGFAAIGVTRWER